MNPARLRSKIVFGLISARPFGLALLIYIGIQSVLGWVAVSLVPTHVSNEHSFSSAPSEYAAVDAKGIYVKELPAPLEHCERIAPTDSREAQDAERLRSPDLTIRCWPQARGDEPPNWYEGKARVTSWAASTDQWELAQTVTIAESGRERLMPDWLLVLPFAIAVFLGRSIRFREDLRNGLKALRRAPYLLLVLPLCAIVLGSLSSVLWSPTLEQTNELTEMLSFVMPSAVGMILVFPMLEEVIFRQWAYKRTISKLPALLVGLLSAWAFTLAHIFNPQVGTFSGYLPTVFMAGCVLFWLRHRYQSLSLSVAAHALNNAVLVVAVLLGGSS